ncbi:LuxR C-terminal-related transcriptional regulator [Leucobacter chromiireducens]|uniref:LuxR C-terminal-related transcriptional regulator n=1 Tax=Leucobacter chromiireducens TaxID=283877 RepID=UPI000F638CD4|nr:LuxR C-terminal-related transcriptional regulator [Leucobacter chromiireducens]
MGDARNTTGGSAQGVASAAGTTGLQERQRIGFTTAVPDRLAHVVSALEPEGAVVLLIGETGSGRQALAASAARAIAERAAGAIRVVELPDPPHAASGHTSVFAEHFGVVLEGRTEAAEIANRVIAGLFALPDEQQAVLVAANADGYSPLDTRLLELLLNDPRIRGVITVKQLTGALERLGIGSPRQQISIAPLSREESERYLCALLGVDRIEAETLRRWLEIAAGSSYALSVLALSADGAGALRRSRGAAWTTVDIDRVPGDYAHAILSSCSREEVAVLELLALAEPVTETALLRSIDATLLAALFDRGLVVSRPHPEGLALLTGHPLIAAMLRTGMSPVRRIQLNDQIFRVLSEGLGGVDPVYTPARLMRLVVFGVESGQHLSFSWLWAAFELTVRGGDPRLVLNVARAVALHPDADPMQAGAGALRACRTARLIGDEGALRPLLGIVGRLLGDPDRVAGMTHMMRVRLVTTIIEQELRDEGDVDVALAQLDALESGLDADELSAREAVRCSKAIALAYVGRLGDAALVVPSDEVSADLKHEWIRSPARAIGGLILDQRGALGRAAANAEHTRRLSRLGPRARPDVVDMQGFCWLLGHWVGGSAELSRRVLDELAAEASADTHAETHYSGLVEAGGVLIAVQEGRWADVAQSAERLIDRLSRHDSYGIATLVQAAFAFALAVLGERDEAARALRASELGTRGIGEAAGGHRRILALRARQWLRDGDVVAAAERTAAWASAQGLELIELQALHVVAFEARSVPAASLERARQIASTVDPPLGDAYLAHIERIAAGTREHAADTDEPEVRLLADLGVWLPLPPVAGLTAREREVALLASLGHSSRFIAERLHISARTVETHLSNVFGKLGVDNRDELRVWAARARATEARGATDPIQRL